MTISVSKVCFLQTLLVLRWQGLLFLWCRSYHTAFSRAIWLSIITNLKSRFWLDFPVAEEISTLPNASKRSASYCSVALKNIWDNVLSYLSMGSMPLGRSGEPVQYTFSFQVRRGALRTCPFRDCLENGCNSCMSLGSIRWIGACRIQAGCFLRYGYLNQARPHVRYSV